MLDSPLRVQLRKFHSELSRNVKIIIAILFLLILMGFGAWVQTWHSAAGLPYELIGIAIYGGPMLLIGIMCVMAGFVKKKEAAKSDIRVFELAWAASIFGPFSVILSNQSVSVSDATVYGLTFFVSVWAAYFGARLIIEGGRFQSVKDDSAQLKPID